MEYSWRGGGRGLCSDAHLLVVSSDWPSIATAACSRKSMIAMHGIVVRQSIHICSGHQRHLWGSCLCWHYLDFHTWWQVELILCLLHLNCSPATDRMHLHLCLQYNIQIPSEFFIFQWLYLPLCICLLYEKQIPELECVCLQWCRFFRFRATP